MARVQEPHPRRDAGGTSITVSPAATSCWANNTPMRVAPSTAHTRGMNCAAQRKIARVVGDQLAPGVRHELFVAVDHRSSVRPLMRIDSDDEHEVLLHQK